MSANTGIVTHGGATHEVNQYYDSVSVQLPGTGHTKTTKYCFISKVDPWTDDNVPPAPQLTQQYIKNVYKNMIAIKRVYPNDMRPMTDRFDWTSGEIYDYYRDDIDIVSKNSNGRMIYRHYVRNRYDQVFKCLWNNNGGVTTNEPYFQPGYMSSSNIYTGLDGYKWIYMYTIESTDKQKFITEDWMPTPLANSAGFGANTVNSGNIPVVNVTNFGGGYYASNTTIRIVGANTRPCIAYANVQSGLVVDITVTDPGEGYISANVEIVSANGTGAIAIAPVSPVGGHGSDPFEEFGTSHIMVTQNFAQDESVDGVGQIPIDINYKQIGFVINPVAKSSYPLQCEESLYSTTTDVIVSNGFNAYVSGEIVYQGVDSSNATFLATCLSFDPSINVIKLINITGTPKLGSTLIGATSSTLRTTLQVTEPDFVPYSGYITYIENRSGTQRSSDGSEQIRLIVGF